LRTPITFRWYGFPVASDGDDLDVATEVFMSAISPPGRVWNPWTSTMIRREFRKRVQAAERGELQPVKEVKSVDEDNPPPLYEIRWQGVSVTSIQDGAQTFSEVVVRMYHSEPPSVPSHFIGHHIHEKDVAASNVYDAQDEEIAVAKQFHDAGEAVNWGIASKPRRV